MRPVVSRDIGGSRSGGEQQVCTQSFVRARGVYGIRDCPVGPGTAQKKDLVQRSKTVTFPLEGVLPDKEGLKQTDIVTTGEIAIGGRLGICVRAEEELVFL